MASYNEIAQIIDDGELLSKIKVAVCISAVSLVEDADNVTANDRKFAKSVFYDPTSEAKKAMRFILAKSNGYSVEQITSADDATIQTAVDSVVPALVLAMSNA